MRGGLSCAIAIMKKPNLQGYILVGTGKCVTTAGKRQLGNEGAGTWGGDEDTNIEWMDIVAMKAKVELKVDSYFRSCLIQPDRKCDV